MMFVMETRTQLNPIRERRGVSAAQLAKLAGVSRQTIYAIEAGDYVPNTTLSLQLAQILEVRVEDLFCLEPANPAPTRPVSVDLLNPEAAHKGQPVQICRVGTHSIGVVSTAQPLMLPVADGVIVETSRQRAGVQLFPDGIDESKRLLIAGCDPGISLLAQHLARFDDVDLVVAPSSSQQALEWLKEGKIHVAGSHLRDASTGEFNLPVVERLFPRGSVKVVTFAIWEQGLVVEAGNPKNIRDAADLARKDVRIINREKGAGSRELLDRKLQEAGVPASKVNGYSKIATGHLPAALAVSQHEADACIASRSAARAFGLSFLPLGVERYDLIVRRQHLRLTGVQALLDVLNRAAIRRKLELLAGYDTSHTGEVLVA
jgi:molybdate-binding protein/DNA-binding XRE family transcriptional regulator